MSIAQYSLDVAAATRRLTLVNTKLWPVERAAGEVACLRPSGREPREEVPGELHTPGPLTPELVRKKRMER